MIKSGLFDDLIILADFLFTVISKERSYATSERVKSHVLPRRERREIGKRLRNTLGGLERYVGGKQEGGERRRRKTGTREREREKEESLNADGGGGGGGGSGGVEKPGKSF